jgi:hypothetical protein
MLEETVTALATGGSCRPEEWACVLVGDVRQFDPFSESLDTLQMERHLAFLAAFAEDIEDVVLRLTPVVADLELD